MLNEQISKSVWVIIPTWNRKDDLLECLDSIQASDYPDMRIIVVDNNSTDGSAEAVRIHYPAVHLIALDKNTGAAFASNRGFDLALAMEADYILRLDSDIIIDSQLISELVSQFEKFPEAGMLYPKILRYDRPDTIWFTGAKSHPFLLVNRVSNLNVKDNFNQMITEVDFVPSAVVMISADAVRATGGFDEIYFVYSEDFDLCLRLRKSGYKIYFIPAARAWHKIGSDKLSHWGVEQFYRGRMLFYRRNTSGLHRFFLSAFAYIYVLYRSIFKHEPLMPALKGLRKGIKES